MNGTIVLKGNVGKALRAKRSAILALDVLDCAGDFHAGDTVYVTFRTLDGSQYVVATGIVCCNAAVLRETGASVRPSHSSRDATDVVVREQDVKLLWPGKPVNT